LYEIKIGKHGVRRGSMGAKASLDFEIFSKKSGILSFELEKQISPLLTPLEKFWKNHLVAPPGKKSFRRP